MGETEKEVERELNMPQTPSTRWCPTPEQLMILEEMYRSRVRAPNASQIQQITAHLSFHRKIEGKNGFYWFQNHKARDRQKLWRKISRHHHQLLLQPLHGNDASSSSSSSQLHGSLEDQACNQLYPYATAAPLHFLPQGDPIQEPAQGINLICKLGTSNGSPPSTGMMYGYDWMTTTESSSSNDAHHDHHQCCKTPTTLNLLPTKNTGLEDECTTLPSLLRAPLPQTKLCC